MKRLFILRHAQSSMNAPSDRERTLTEHGHSQAKGLGELMQAKDFVPDFIYCSPARRTVETCEGLAFGGVAIEHPEKMYNAPTEDLVTFIQSTKDEVQNLLVIAHNPGIYYLAHSLSKEAVSENYEKLMHGYPPASLSVLECDIESWSDIQPRKNTLVELIN